VIPGSLSKPPPSASRPPHRGEKAKYKRDRDLHACRLSPRLSLKLSLSALRTGDERRRTRHLERQSEGSGSFRRQQCRQLIGARRFTRMSRRPHIWSVLRRGREARAELARERSAGRRRSTKPLHLSWFRDQRSGCWSGWVLLNLAARQERLCDVRRRDFAIANPPRGFGGRRIAGVGG
jgi:hypothetical protein